MAIYENLIHAVVRRQALGCLPFREAPQAGRIGQWRAIQGYDVRRGLAFSAYAWACMMHQVWRAIQAAERCERAITLGGLSKAYGLPGLRTGWLALQDRALRDRIQVWRDYTTICASAPSERLAQIALQAGDALIARNLRLVRENLALAEPFFERWSAVFRWNRPQAGSVALVGLRRGSAQGFCERLVAEQGVLLLPATGLGYGDGHIRFGFGRRSFPEALAQLASFLEQAESTVRRV
jgi:aspartate/methionine/tyrosine aminotransferase